jgi:hypothetical protein
VPLNKTFINTINIEIKDNIGNNITFKNLLSKVIIKLHFRFKNGLQ